jgi:O-antigen ligase
MENIFNFLSNVWLDIKQENKAHFSFIPFLLVLGTIPLSYGVNNVFLVIFAISVLLRLSKNTFQFQKSFMLPIGLFSLMCISYFWSIDTSATLKAIPKEIALLIIPLLFMAMKPFTKEQIQKILQYYSYVMVLYVVFYLVKAAVRFYLTGDTGVLFYHELVTKKLNAIHVSVYVAIAFFYFFTKEVKTGTEKLISFLLFGFIILLSSKNIILVFVLLILIEYFFYSKIAHKMRLRNLLLFSVLFISLFFVGKIKDRFMYEFKSNTEKSLSSTVIDKNMVGVNVLSVKEAWTNEKFSPNDFFPGTAFRVYQARLFFELIQEDNVFWTGFGLNASYKKLEEKAIQYDVYRGNGPEEGYQSKNFHNQYIQNFAELGVFGFLLLVIILVVSLKKSIQNKDFVQISFAVLMISLFLTESFLWRQRGVVFFTLLFCLFYKENTFAPKKNSL